MDRRHFIGQSAAALGMLAGFSGQARANLQNRTPTNWTLSAKIKPLSLHL